MNSTDMDRRQDGVIKLRDAVYKICIEAYENTNAKRLSRDLLKKLGDPRADGIDIDIGGGE